MVAGLLCLASLALSAPHDVGAEIAALEKESGRRIGMMAIDTGSGKTITHRPNERFLLCSTFKFLAAAAVLKNVDDGREELDRFVRFGPQDMLEYAPVTKEHLAEGGMKLGDLCAAAIALSDNTAGNLLLRSIGGPASLTKFARSLGDRVTRLDRMEPELNQGGPGDERDTTTPAAMCDDWVKILTTEILSASSRAQLETWIARNQTGTKLIRAGIPGTWKIGDKTGRSRDGAINDVAMLRPPGAKPIFLAIYSTGPDEDPQAQNAVLAQVARIVVESLRPERPRN